MQQPIDVQIKILDARYREQDSLFKLPEYATAGSAGLDLRAAITNPLKLAPNETAMIPTGLSIWLNNNSYAAVILPRSGLGHKGLVLGNLVGLIDSDYQGELKISCWNRSTETKLIEVGDRIAQLIIVPIMQANFLTVEEFEDKTLRGSGGFGHTGK